MTRLAVVADIHCDDFGSKIDATSGLNARWVDGIAMLRWVANDARARGADALIVAGDLSETRHPAPWRVAQIGEALDEFGGPVVLARGNHDGERAGRSIVDVLATGRAGWSGFSRPGVAVIHGTAIAVLPFLDRHWLRAQPGFEKTPDAEVFRVLAEQFLAMASGLYVQASDQGKGGAVLIVHQGLAGGNMSEVQQAFLGDLSLVVDTRALAAIGYDAILAGHFHLHQVLSERPLIAYAGSPYRTDFGEEDQAKGYLVVDVEPGSAAMEFVETPARRFVTIGPDDLDPIDVEGAIVRCVGVPPEVDVVELRKRLEADGAFEVTEIRQARPDAPEATGGMSEGLSAEQALEAHFADEPDAAALVALGREILEAVA